MHTVKIVHHHRVLTVPGYLFRADLEFENDIIKHIMEPLVLRQLDGLHSKFGQINVTKSSTLNRPTFPTCMSTACALNFKLIPALLCPEVIVQNWN
ncbi:hypothetical protein EXN66_Car020782 [Channa argus]|uniref:Uncharacterized protein n=1 Tax=Channa argus TaxID=215402 RepID=A0A6G1QQY0_CHAAH|nr:hypothetical protein EXN66_Car020782 [Channa argus]